MTALSDIVTKIRSKNAGPFWLTIDIFCGSADAYDTVSNGLDTAVVAQVFGIPVSTLKRFDIKDLNIVKFSLPRPEIQGIRLDRDMHGASFAQILTTLEI
ncbi:DUF4387 family protein [Aestuariibius sp. HNIBRBA575]|uniref:DUF4387 family protein n=1 Tax=Aestuariibius sp. HNIBRBA575 TaxID=3233343 RepID=UPI0034A2535A